MAKYCVSGRLNRPKLLAYLQKSIPWIDYSSVLSNPQGGFILHWSTDSRQEAEKVASTFLDLREDGTVVSISEDWLPENKSTPLVKKSETENTEPGDGDEILLPPIEGNSQSSDEDAERQALLARPISELNLSGKGRRGMLRLSINTFGDLVKHSGDDLLDHCKNFGAVTLNEIREKLVAFGLKLRGDE